MLENQCSVWPDPIAAVAYIPTLRGRIFSPDDPALNGSHLGVAVERVSAFFERMEQQGGQLICGAWASPAGHCCTKACPILHFWGVILLLAMSWSTTAGRRAAERGWLFSPRGLMFICGRAAQRVA